MGEIGYRSAHTKSGRNAMTAAAKAQPSDLQSGHVKPDEMPWQALQFPGCEVKPLYVDPKAGMATLLFRMAPGAVLPDHEHALIEQTYVLEGSLVDKEGPDAGLAVKAGEFVWRPAGSRHVATSPDGALMIAIFLVPNKFFREDGRVTDQAGRDWQATWGHALEA
jgi:quercetin dioxygenase-like cupin family protein